MKRSLMVASAAQRGRVYGKSCAVCGSPPPCDPAHLIPRSLLTDRQDDPKAVIPLDRGCHRAYDEGKLDLLPHLEPRYRVELGFAVERFGLLNTVRRVTNER